MNISILHAIDIFAVFVGMLGIGVIMFGVVRALKAFIALEIGLKHKKRNHNAIRYQLGIYLLLGLEFMVAADIIETVFKPSLEQLGILGGIVVIRTLLNYFLTKELEQIKEEVE